ncbi:MAG TPA: GNAT family N-acetyltransferase [Enterococcus columbae]|nr:GNAT family N-acetyltransferase [Enterococcus columbae]
MQFETKRLILRPWQIEDAHELYQLAKDPLVGPNAGWNPHESVAESLEVIENFFVDDPLSFAICDQSTKALIGSISLMPARYEGAKSAKYEREIGYWLAPSFWGQGLIPEAIRCLQTYAFETMGIESLWAGYFAGNHNSQRALEKCGFHFQHTEEVYIAPLAAQKTEHYLAITKEQWQHGRDWNEN